MTKIDWTRHYVRQEDGWCGPAVLKMVLSAVGIAKTQTEIVADTSIMIAYLSRFFSELGFLTGAAIADIENHLNSGHFVIVDWWDDLTDDPNDPPDGHYSIVAAVDRGRGTIKLIDPYLLKSPRDRVPFSGKNLAKSSFFSSVDSEQKLTIATLGL